MVEWKTYGKQGGYTISYICPICGYETMVKSDNCPQCQERMIDRTVSPVVYGYTTHWYACSHCKSELEYGASECKKCNSKINWEGFM